MKLVKSNDKKDKTNIKLNMASTAILSPASMAKSTVFTTFLKVKKRGTNNFKVLGSHGDDNVQSSIPVTSSPFYIAQDKQNLPIAKNNNSALAILYHHPGSRHSNNIFMWMTNNHSIQSLKLFSYYG